jgi:hypothetical protein
MKKIIFITIVFISFANQFVIGQDIGINTDNPKTSLDIDGDLALNYGILKLQSTSIKSIDCKNNPKSFYFISNESGDFNIYSITGGTNGRFLVLINVSTYQMSLKDNTLNSNIYSNFEKEIKVQSQGIVMLSYNHKTDKWMQMALGGSNNSKWLTTGNGNIDVNDFLGTVNANDLIFKTNNNEVAKITPDQKVFFGKSGNQNNNITIVNGNVEIEQGNLNLKNTANGNEMNLSTNGIYSNNKPTLLNKDGGQVGINLNGKLPTASLDVNGTGYFSNSIQGGANLEVNGNLNVGNNLYAYNRTIETPTTYGMKNNLLPIAWGRVEANGQPDPLRGSRNFNVEHNSAYAGYKISVPGYSDIVVILTGRTGSITTYLDDPSSIIQDIFGDGRQSSNSTLVFFEAYESGHGFDEIKAFQYQKGSFVSPNASMGFEFVAFGKKINP